MANCYDANALICRYLLAKGNVVTLLSKTKDHNFLMSDTAIYCHLRVKDPYCHQDTNVRILLILILLIL